MAADLLRPYLKEGQKVIWREAFRWQDDNGVLSNHYDGMELEQLADDFGYDWRYDMNFKHAAIVWNKVAASPQHQVKKGESSSLFQCQVCGCAENTALASQGCDGYAIKFFDWTGIEDRKGKKLCSVCAPMKYSDGAPTAYGKWHDRFTRTFLPLGMFVTNDKGNLAHRETGDENYRGYALVGAAAQSQEGGK